MSCVEKIFHALDVSISECCIVCFIHLGQDNVYRSSNIWYFITVVLRQVVAQERNRTLIAVVAEYKDIVTVLAVFLDLLDFLVEESSVKLCGMTFIDHNIVIYFYFYMFGILLLIRQDSKDVPDIVLCDDLFEVWESSEVFVDHKDVPDDMTEAVCRGFESFEVLFHVVDIFSFFEVYIVCNA